MKQAKTLKSDELKLVLAYIAVRRHAARNRTIVLASFLSGMRAHELASLKIGDVVDEDGRVRSEILLAIVQTKGRRARRVFVNAKLRRELAAYVKSRCANKPLGSPLFVSQKRRALSCPVRASVSRVTDDFPAQPRGRRRQKRLGRRFFGVTGIGGASGPFPEREQGRPDSPQRGSGAHVRNGRDPAVDQEVCSDDVRGIVRREVNC